MGFSLGNGSDGVETQVSVTAGENIAGADMVIWNASPSSSDAASIDSFLASQAGSFDGGVFVASYVNGGQVGVWYDDDANTNDEGNGATLLVTLADVTSLTALVSASGTGWWSLDAIA